MAVPAPTPDRWSRWFFRLVQLVGLALGVNEALGRGRPWVLLFSGALILGAIGLRIMLRGAAVLVDTAVKETDPTQRG
jgi:hypothetical protein